MMDYGLWVRSSCGSCYLTSQLPNLPTPDFRLRLLAYPLPAAALRPHPGGGVGAGAGVEDVVLGERRAEPGPRLELEQPVRPARSVDCRRHQIGFTAGHAHHVL